MYQHVHEAITEILHLSEAVEADLELSVAGHELSLELSACEVSRDPRLDLLELEWLGDIVYATRLESADLVDGVAEGTEKDDRDVLEECVG